MIENTCGGTLVSCWKVERKVNDYVTIDGGMTHMGLLFFQKGAISCSTSIFW